MKIIGTERDYQRYIIDYLIDNNGYIERKCKTNYDRTTAMDRELLFRFLDTTQPDTMAALRKIYNGQTEETIVKFILQSIDNKGSSLIETLKSGIEISNMHLDLLYSKPATDYNIDLVAKYNANIFSIMEEVWINDDQRIDLVVFLNGFAIATFELKCQSAGQNYRMAIKQYSEDRDPKNRLFLFKAGALVNFAMDLDTCYMTTKLDGLGTRFIPFNRGRGEGVNTGEGNPLDFAFTATPKPMTLRLFGRESIDADGNPVYQPFHLYSMKQAIEEGYILDVLQNYIEYKTYYKLNKTIEDDPEMKTIAAKRQIARYIDLFDDNINQRVNIIVEHFRSTVMQELGGQAKAMVITASREAAVKYRQAFEDYVTRHNYKDVKALVAFSGKVKIDDTEYTEPSMNGFAEDKLPKVFDGDEYNVLLVANKYQVGFDQPKLCAMYVLKKLRGVNAVQTLSRLNRVCPPFDKKVVVMDFVNHAEEMEDAFAPFYTTTVLSNTATIAQLRELENKIDGYNVLDDRDVDTVASIVYNPKGKRTTAKEDRLVYQCIQRAVNVLKNQFNEDHQRAFTKNCRGFVRLYEFLSMASSFGDPELHKKYVFVNLLLTYLLVGNSGGISLKDKIQATNFVQESQGDKGNKQRHASAPNVKLSGADVGLTVDEVKHLSEIIDEVNSRAGKGYDSSAMTKVMLQIKDLLLHSEKLKTSAKNNTEQDFEFSFYDNTDDALIEGLSQNQDFFSLLLSNDDIKHRVLGVFLHEVYKELREQP